MSLGHLLLGLWFILVGITWLTWVTISSQFLGGLAAITGLIWLLESYHPVTIWKRS